MKRISALLLSALFVANVTTVTTAQAISWESVKSSTISAIKNYAKPVAKIAAGTLLAYTALCAARAGILDLTEAMRQDALTEKLELLLLLHNSTPVETTKNVVAPDIGLLPDPIFPISSCQRNGITWLTTSAALAVFSVWAFWSAKNNVQKVNAVHSDAAQTAQ
jgi:hypothetical protein